MLRIFVALLLTGASVRSEIIVGSWNLTLSPEAGGLRTLIQIYTTGTVYLPQQTNATYVGGLGIAYSGMPGQQPSNTAWNMGDRGFDIPSIGNITNSTASTSRALNHLRFTTSTSESLTPGARFIMMMWLPGEPWFYVRPSDVVTFEIFPSPAEFEIELEFSNFNLGSYSYTAANTEFNMKIIPEPSSLSLLLAGGAVLLAGRRRKSD